MAENQDGQEKSQEPTARRLQQAREKGQVARSRELTTLAVTLVNSSRADPSRPTALPISAIPSGAS